jgi:CubicO group peptidase (beta-lactamase class C family)
MTVLTGLAALAALAAAQADAPTLEARLEAVIDRTEGFSGLVLVGRGEETLAELRRGLAHMPEGRPLAEGDVWRYASITKQMTGVLVMQEVEAGRLSLGDRLAELLPDRELGAAGATTVEQLLRHTSGLRDLDDLTVEEYSTGFEPVDWCLQASDGRPGERFEYNNCDFVALGVLLEQSSGRPWDVLMRERLFEPAGMSTAVASGGVDGVEGHDEAGAVYVHAPLTSYGASGGAVGEPRDLLRFNAALMDGTYLGEAALARLWEGEPSLGYVALGAWSFSAPLDGCEGAVRLIERRGSIGGVNARNLIAPDLGLSLVIFSNTPAFQFGEIWMGQGGSYELASAAFCVG